MTFEETKTEAGDFINMTNAFDGVILTGHGDESQSAAITIDTLESVLKRNHSTLDVGMALSCHGFYYMSSVCDAGYMSSSALIIGYSGYAINTSAKRYIVGTAINQWVKQPAFTSVYLDNPVIDGGAIAGKAILSGIGDVLDMMDGNFDF
jgi:hypothetical protein